MKTKSRKLFAGALAVCLVLLAGSFHSTAAEGTVSFLGSAGLVKEGQALAAFEPGEGLARNLVLIVKKQEEIRQQEEARRQEEERQQEEARRQEEAAQAEAAQTAAVSGGDKDLLAALIYCEAGGEPYEGQVAIGAVVMNRVKSGVFPGTVREVIYQSGQFGPAITGKLDRVLASGGATESCYQAAQEALNGVSPVGDALYFGDGQNYGIQIGGHWFHT